MSYKNKQQHCEYMRNRRKTLIGRAEHLLAAYNAADQKRRSCTGDLTAQWIVENIFSKSCAHCGETDWTKIGCNRIDNSLPHTKDNVEPCCEECNHKLNGNNPKTVYQYTLDGVLLRIWKNTHECGKNGFLQSKVSNCCLGKQEKHRGFRWSYTPL